MVYTLREGGRKAGKPSDAAVATVSPDVATGEARVAVLRVRAARR